MTPTTLTALCFASLTPLLCAQEFRFEHENVLGTSMDLTIEAADATIAAGCESVVLAEIDRLGRMLSGHDSGSEFRRLTASAQSREISQELFEVLDACDRWGRETGGAFDAAFARKEPAGARAEGAANGYRSPWQLTADPRTARIRTTDPIGIDGLAKGYIIDRASARGLAVAGVSGLVLDIGGDIRVAGKLTRTVRITDPSAPADNARPMATVALRDASIASSGGYARPILDDSGRRVSHIIDPRMGRPANGMLSATVVAERCADADALATALNVMTVERGLRLIESLPRTECALVTADGHRHHSTGWQRLLVGDDGDSEPRPRHIRDFAFEFRFRLGSPEGKQRRRYRRPYVAAWIEDESGKPVRTLCLWMGNRRWLRDLKTWYKLHRRRGDFADNVSRATRRPGEYLLTWNGKDDDGEELPIGTYTLLLEVAREHGTHQLMRAPIVFRDGHGAVMDPNLEVESAVLSIKRRTAESGR